jgi:carboxypeptidase Taq
MQQIRKRKPTARQGMIAAKPARNRRSAEQMLVELKRRLREASDLTAAGDVLNWDQATYMPRGGADARGRQCAVIFRLAHEQAVSPALGKLLDALARYGESLPHNSDDASLIRVARRDFQKMIKIPTDHVASANAHLSASYNAWTRARPADDFAAMVPYLERTLDLSREYSSYFASYKHVADPLIDDADEGTTTVSIRKLFSELKASLSRWCVRSASNLSVTTPAPRNHGCARRRSPRAATGFHGRRSRLPFPAGCRRARRLRPARTRLPSKSGSLAIRASSRVSRCAADRRPGSSSK